MSVIKIDYQNRLVAFLDVMGFKDLLKGDQQSQIKISEYFSTVTTVVEYFQKEYSERYIDHDFASALVSDAVILSVDLPTGQADRNQVTSRFLSAVGLLQYRLAVDRDIWLRGAVSSGDFYIESSKNIIVGPAFVQAYELEQTANFPRVIVDPRVCRAIGCLPAQFVALMNRTSEVGKLMPYPVQPKLGILQNDPIAIEIDWFSHAFLNKEPLTIFFDGVRARSVANHGLFVKSHLLVRMIRDSYNSAISDRNMPENDRTRTIEQFLAEFGV